MSRITTHHLAMLRQRGERAVFVTAYDYPTAHYADRAGVDMILVGDSAAMTMLGLPSTLGIGMEEMLVFARAVSRAAKRAFVIGDMPFLSYQPSDACAIRNAGAFLGSAGCDAVKCEGGRRTSRRVSAMVNAGIPVMGHLGLTPQSAGQSGGYRVQGKTLDAVRRLRDDALVLEDAGVFALLLEAMPAESAAYVRDHLSVPVYGIGAGPHLDGQLLICHDLLGSFVGDVSPRFAKRYAELGTATEEAFRAYVADVQAGHFPGPEQCYPLDPSAEAEIRGARQLPNPDVLLGRPRVPESAGG